MPGKFRNATSRRRHRRMRRGTGVASAHTPLPALMPWGRRAGLKAAVGIVVGATAAAVVGALTLGAVGAQAVPAGGGGGGGGGGAMSSSGGRLRRMLWGRRRRGPW